MSDQREPNGSSTGVSSAAVDARITDAVVALDEEWQFTYLNERAERVLQRSEEDLLGTSVWNAFPDAAGSTFRREFERAMETQEPASFEAFYQPLDTWFEVRAYPSETGLSVSILDTAEGVSRENPSQARERAMRRAYEVIGDPDRTFSQQIDALLEVVREAIGTDYATLSRVHQDADRYIFESVDVPDDVDLEAGDEVPLSELPNCAHVVEVERTLVLKDVEAEAPELADPTWGISCYLGAPVSVDSEVYGTFCFYGMEARSEDFTDWEMTFVELLSRWVSSELERRRTEAELAETVERLEQSNDELERFAYVVSHDLREPLRMVSSYVQLLEERYADELDGDADDFIQFAVDGAERMQRMIEDLLDYSRVDTQGDPFEPVDLSTVLDHALANLEVAVEERDADVTADELPTVAGDETQLMKVFQNLLSNAIEYNEGTPHVHVGAKRRADAWRFSVRDDGVGIEPDDRERIFDVFSRLHDDEYEGTGIGLSICQKIVERHGGDIWVESEPGEGTTFLFTIPDAA